MENVIALEGLDKSGKNTAANTIVEYLELQGFTVKKFTYPNYETPLGKIISQYLTNQIELTPASFEYIMAAEKLEAQEKVRQASRQYNFVVLDRSIFSQLAYGAINLKEHILKTILDPLDYPNYMLYMDVSVENSMSRKGEHGDNDRYESNKELLTKVSDNYKKILHKIGYAVKTDMYRIDANKPLDKVKKDLFTICDIIIHEVTYGQ